MNVITQTMEQENNTHAKQKQKENVMENISHKLRSSGICLLLAAAFALPGVGHATIIDQVKSKVDAIKNDTATLKNKTTAIQSKVSAVSSNVNAQIAEMDKLKATLDSLKQMKDKFSGGGFDPAQLLELVNFEELQLKIDDLKQKRQEVKDRLNDPDLEAFRAELLETLVTLNKLVAVDGTLGQVTPFQTLVANAPLPVIALLKQPFEPLLVRLQERIAKASNSMAKLQELGLWELIQSLDPDPERVCNAVNLVGAGSVWVFLWKHEAYMETVKKNWERATASVGKVETVSAQLYPKMGVHGYLTFGMPKTMVAKNMADANGLKGGIDWQIKKTSQLKEIVEWMRDSSDACDIVFASN